MRMTTKGWTAIGSVAAVMGLGIGACGLFSGGDEARSTNVNVEGAGGDGTDQICTQVGSGDQRCKVEVVESLEGANEREVIAAAEATADVAPAAKGPWPFYVVKTAPLGLKVRSTNVVEATQLGAIGNLNPGWAWCRQESSFDPVPDDEVGALWLQIGWDHQEPNETEYFNSEPDAAGRAWIYAGFTVPVGHSGEVPEC